MDIVSHHMEQPTAGLLAALRNLPEVKAEMGVAEQEQATSRDLKCDAQVDVKAGGNSASLLVQVMKSVYPREVRQAAWYWRSLLRKLPSEGKRRELLLCVAAHSISPGAKELLRSERIGYYDSAGSLFLPANSFYVYIDRPPPKRMSRSIRSVFSGRRAQVVHALLQRNREWFGVQETAEQARVSPATASQVLVALEKFGWVVTRGRGPRKKRHLQGPGAMLDAWVDQLKGLRLPSMQRYFVPLLRADALVERLAEVCAEFKAEYAITHEAAGQRYAPWLTSISQVRCRLPDGPAAKRVLRALDARSVDRGANLAVIESKSEGDLLFSEPLNGVWLASPVQVYLDLIRSEGRAKELAQHLREERIGI